MDGLLLDSGNFGWYSLLPPLVAIGLAIVTRHVFVSLFSGLFVGCIIAAGGNPFYGFYALITEFLVPSVTDETNAGVLILLMCIGGYVALLQVSGGMAAFAHLSRKFVKDHVTAHISVWVTGIIIFFSDTANTLILGPLYTPIFDRLKISREKLSYLIDSTASPVSILVPTTSWGAYIASLIAIEYAALELENEGLEIGQSGMAGLLSAFPFQFYALAMLLLVFFVGAFKLDFGLMRKADKRVRETGQIIPDGSTPMRIEAPMEVPESPKTKARAMLFSIVVLFAGVLGMFVWTGMKELIAIAAAETEASGVLVEPVLSLGGALSNGNGVPSVTVGFLIAGAFMGMFMLFNKSSKGKVVVDDWIKGAGSVFSVLMILAFAWALGAVCKYIGTHTFVSTAVSGAVDPNFIPALIFLVGASISFAIGTSWGTFAILMPIAIPLAHQVGIPYPIVIGAVLSGGLFGDHCSPISDTTILSSIGAACDHMDHVKTQLPYAMLAAFAAASAYIVASITGSAWSLLFCFAVLVAAVLVIRGWQARGAKSGAAP